MVSMEVPEPLSVESFSYRWLVDLDSPPEAPPVGSFRRSFDEASFIEMDPAMPPSRRFSVTSFSPDFKFDSPASRQPSLDVVHADELFAEGYVLPLFFDHLTRTNHIECRASGSTLPRECDSQQAATVVNIPASDDRFASSSSESCQRPPKQIFLKHLNFLRPFYQFFRRQRLSSRPRYGEQRGHGMRSWVYPEESPSSSPRISSAFSADDDRKSSFSECSIYEAVLHCKKSIGRETDRASKEKQGKRQQSD